MLSSITDWNFRSRQVSQQDGWVLGEHFRDGEGQSQLLLLLQGKTIFKTTQWLNVCVTVNLTWKCSDWCVHPRGKMLPDPQQADVLSDDPPPKPLHQPSKLGQDCRRKPSCQCHRWGDAGLVFALFLNFVFQSWNRLYCIVCFPKEHYDNFFEDVFVECEDKYGQVVKITKNADKVKNSFN